MNNSYISPDEIKLHLNIDTDYAGDDDYLASLVDVAAYAIENHINDKLVSLEDTEGSIPPPVRHAIKLMVGHLYANREMVALGTIVAKIPMSYEYLLAPYIAYK